MNWSRNTLFAFAAALLLVAVFWIARTVTHFAAHLIVGSEGVLVAMILAVRAINGPFASDKLIRNYRLTRTVPLFLFGVALLLNNNVLEVVLIGGALFIQIIVVRHLRGKLLAHLDVSKQRLTS